MECQARSPFAGQTENRLNLWRAYIRCDELSRFSFAAGGSGISRTRQPGGFPARRIADFKSRSLRLYPGLGSTACLGFQSFVHEIDLHHFVLHLQEDPVVMHHLVEPEDELFH